MSFNNCLIKSAKYNKVNFSKIKRAVTLINIAIINNVQAVQNIYVDHPKF